MRFTWIVVVVAAMGSWSWAQTTAPVTRPAGDADPLLKQALANDSAAARKAVQAMGKLAQGDQYEATMPKLKRVVDEQKDATVRAQVAVELSEIIKARKLVDPPAVLIKLCKDQSPDVRLKAFVALSNINAEGAVRPLVDGLHDPDAKVRTAAYQAWVDLIGSDPVPETYHPVTNADPAYPMNKGTMEKWEEYVRVTRQRLRDRGM